MSETTLYRKYRPTKWSEIVGQDSVVTALRGYLASKQIAQAYLFTGPRGTGKTSLARIFARELGCEDHDLAEIDGASNNGVDEIRELREAVGVLPFSSKYKIYIIDEVHMLSKPAFNALLKTLEEPPSHVIFILATTELNKMPETVVSRCQVLTFSRPDPEMLKKVIRSVVKNEGYKIDEKSAHLIALLGEGSYRDTLGLLQRVMVSSTDKELILTEVEKITGAPKRELVKDFVRAILVNDSNRALILIETLGRSGTDMKVLLKLILEELRRGIFASFSPDLLGSDYLAVDKDELIFYQELANGDEAKVLPAILKEFLIAYEQLDSAYLPTLPLELAVTNIARQRTENK